MNDDDFKDHVTSSLGEINVALASLQTHTAILLECVDKFEKAIEKQDDRVRKVETDVAVLGSAHKKGLFFLAGLQVIFSTIAGIVGVSK